MQDVIDIIHNLSYNIVGEENLQKVIANFNQQTKVIDNMTEKLHQANAEHAKYTQTLKEGGTVQAAALEKVITKEKDLSTSINQRTIALKSVFQNNALVQKQLGTEVGLITQLTTKIKELNAARMQATTPGVIGGINKEIVAAKMELNGLMGVGGEGGKNGGGGFIASLLGLSGSGGGIGRQILTGTLMGVGFGSGFGLITRAVSGLIEYAEAEFDATKKAEMLQKANEGLAQSFDKLSAAIEKEDAFLISLLEHETSERIGIDITAQGYKLKADAVKALGVVRGEQFEAEKKQFEAEQLQRGIDQADLEHKLFVAKNYENGLKAAREAAASVSPEDAFDTKGSLGKRQLKAISKSFANTGIPSGGDMISEMKKQIDEDANIMDILAKKQDEAENKRQLAQDAVDAKTAERKNATTAYQAKVNAEISALDLKLYRDNADEKQKYSDSVFNKQLTITASENGILESINREKSERLNKIDREYWDERQKLAEQGHKMNAETETLFAQKRIQVQRETDDKIVEELYQFHKKQDEAENKVNEILNSMATAQSRGDIIQGNIDRNPSVSNYRDFNQYTNAGALMALLDQKEQALNTARAVGGDLQLINETFDRAEIVLFKKTQQDKLEALKAFVHDYDIILKSIGQSAKDNINIISKEAQYGFSPDTNLGELTLSDIAKGIRHRRNNKGFFGDRNAVSDAQAGINNAKVDVSEAQNEQTSLPPGSSQAEIDAANAKVIEAINKEDAAQQVMHNLMVQRFKTEADLYSSLANTAVNMYDTITKAREQDLDREIAVRTQRVDMAEKLAERGNTQALAQEQKALDAANKQKRQAALQDQEINAALTVSNALVAVAKAAAEGGILAPATIALALTAIGIGFAEAEALGNAQKQQFFKGGYTGEGGKYDVAGTVHKGEFVTNKETTEKFRPFLEAMHQGIHPFDMIPEARLVKSMDGHVFVTAKELKEHGNMIVDAVLGKTVHVEQNVNKSGVHQIVVEETKAHANKWRH